VVGEPSVPFKPDKRGGPDERLMRIEFGDLEWKGREGGREEDQSRKLELGPVFPLFRRVFA
jgi:hypothetical protein